MSGYGVDIARERADDLDRRLLAELAKEPEKAARVLDLACGSGGMSAKIAKLGATVVAVDIEDYQQNFAEIREKLAVPEDKLCFVQADLAKLNLEDFGQFDFVLWQRAIHYLPHQTAKDFLRRLRGVVSKKLFLSATGLETAVAEYYPARGERPQNRFAVLGPLSRALFFIDQPVCLYRPEELTELLREAGWQVEECWVSAFGNIKLTAKPDKALDKPENLL